VILGCRSKASGLDAAKELKAEGVGGVDVVDVVELDVTCSASVASAAEAVSSLVGETGGLSILINNAGVLVEDAGAGSISFALATNFEGVVRTTLAFEPLLKAGSTVLTTSSSGGTRFMASLEEEDSAALLSEDLTLEALRYKVKALAEQVADPSHRLHQLSTPAYNLSKCAANCYTQILSRSRPDLFVNAVSPGFSNTGMCANYSGSRVPKSPELGATVIVEALEGVGKGKTGLFLKQNSKAGCKVEDAETVVTAWKT